MKKKAAAPSKSLTAKPIGAGYVIGLYLAACIVRIVLAQLFTDGPVVMIDESLYTNIARSLRDSFTLAYRGQPVDYPYIFYPLLLIPMYLFRLPVDLYRAVQGYNILWVTSSVFPVYLLAWKFLSDDRKAFGAALITALMPDMLMGNYLMSECILWPLGLWMAYFAYRSFCAPEKVGDALAVALFTALMYFTKPGAVAVGAVLLAGRLVFSIVQKNRRAVGISLASILTLGILLVLINVLYIFGFGYEPSFLALYAKQSPTADPGIILLNIESSFLLVFLFVFACGGVYAVMPISCIGDYDAPRRQFILTMTMGVLAAIIGTAVFVVSYEWTGSYANMCLHLRYCAMYVPLYFIFTLAIDRNKRKKAVGRSAYIALIVFMVLVIFPGGRIGSVAGESNLIDNLALSAFYNNWRIGVFPGIALSAITVLFIGFLCVWFSEGFTAKTQRGCAAFFVVFLLINNVCGYMGGNVYIDPTIGEDAMEVNQWVEDESGECLGITQLYYNDIRTYWLEARLRKPMQQVTHDNLVVAMLETGGVYEPFVPADQAPNIGNGLTPETNVLILGMTIREHLELSDGIESQTTSHGHFTKVSLKNGERWVDTIMRGLDDDTLYSDKVATVYLLNPDRFDSDEYTLNITARGLNESTTMKVEAGGVEQVIALTTAVQTYTLRLPVSQANITLSSGNAEILSYTTEG